MRTSLAHRPERKQAAFTHGRPKPHDLSKLRKRIGELDRRTLKSYLSATIVPMLESHGSAAGQLEAKQWEGKPDAGVTASPGEAMPDAAMPRLLEAG